MFEREAATAAAIQVSVRLFAHYRDRTGVAGHMLTVPEGSTVRELVARLRCEAGFEVLPPDPVVAVNREYAALDRKVVDGDEVALIPPVSGG